MGSISGCWGLAEPCPQTSSPFKLSWLGQGKVITARPWVIWMSENSSCGSSCCRVCWWWNKDYMCMGPEGKGCIFSFSFSRKDAFSFPAGPLVCLWQYYIFFSKMEEGRNVIASLPFSRGQLPVLKHRLALSSYTGIFPSNIPAEKNWIRYFFSVLTQKDFTLEASSMQFV